MTLPTAHDERAAWIGGIASVDQSPDFEPLRPNAFGLLAAPAANPVAVEKVLAWLRARIGMTLDANGSNEIIRLYSSYDPANYPPRGGWAWCAATASCAVRETGAGAIMRPRAYVPWLVSDGIAGQAASIWTNGAGGIQPGDQVVYSWSRRFGSPEYGDHVGTIERVYADGTFDALEGNAGEGELLRVRRDPFYVLGYRRLNYAAAPKPIAPTSQEDDPFMALTDAEQREILTRLRNLPTAILDAKVDRIDPTKAPDKAGKYPVSGQTTLRQELSWTARNVAGTRSLISALAAKVTGR